MPLPWKAHWKRKTQNVTVWQFLFDNQPLICVTKSSDGWWEVLQGVGSMMSDYFYYRFGYAPSLREAMQEFRDFKK